MNVSGGMSLFFSQMMALTVLTVANDGFDSFEMTVRFCSMTV